MLLTIDIGTSNFKSAVWDYDGKCLSSTAFPLSVTVSNGIIHEVDCSQWLSAFENNCRFYGNLKCIDAIVISGNGPTLVPVLGVPRFENNKLSVPSENARLWLDRRAVKYQEEVSALTGGFVDAAFFLPKILGIKNGERELYNKTKCFLGCPEYLAYAITGEARTVIPSDGFDRWFWNDSILKKLELDSEKFPAFIHPGDLFGEITVQVAEYFGFSNKVKVISGGPDFFAAILGAGVTQPGQACDRTGSSEGINLCTKDRINDDKLMSYGHPIKPYWNLSGIINTTGKAIEWGSSLLGFNNLQDFFALAKESKAGSGGLIFNPYLAGERAPLWDTKIRGSWKGINLSSGRSEFANSILEGISFAIRDVITVMEKTGEKVSNLRVTGKLAESEHLNQIKADITGKEVLLPVQKNAELLGLNIIGACTLGRYASFAEASNVMVKIEKTYQPNINNAKLYNELFEKYKIKE